MACGGDGHEEGAGGRAKGIPWTMLAYGGDISCRAWLAACGIQARLAYSLTARVEEHNCLRAAR